ncbi:MAG: hypothetical protein HQL29_04450 [Candidatus Omnitrophica bacterium]|nr:hypothetical protein [Candidatus Omnitrophota bacterium]
MEKNKLFDSFAEAISKTTTELLKVNVFGEPELKGHDIVEWYGKLKLFPWSKFHLPTYFCIMYYYAGEQDKESHKPVGSIIIYFERKESRDLLVPISSSRSINTQDIAGIEDHDEKEKKLNLKSVGEFSRKVSMYSLSGLQGQGYEGLVLSEPHTLTAHESKDTIPFNSKTKKIYEMKFILERGQEIILDYIFPE